MALKKIIEEWLRQEKIIKLQREMEELKYHQLMDEIWRNYIEGESERTK